jgi:hypothetical protein
VDDGTQSLLEGRLVEPAGRTVYGGVVGHVP